MVAIFNRYEEEHMLRLQHKKRSRESGRSTRETLDELTDFSALEAITQEVCLCRIYPTHFTDILFSFCVRVSGWRC